MQSVDKEIKITYIKGFSDELRSIKPPDWFKTELEKKAYFTGRSDAVIGDDVDSYNYRSWEETLKQIKNL